MYASGKVSLLATSSLLSLLSDQLFREYAPSSLAENAYASSLTESSSPSSPHRLGKRWTELGRRVDEPREVGISTFMTTSSNWGVAGSLFFRFGSGTITMVPMAPPRCLKQQHFLHRQTQTQQQIKNASIKRVAHEMITIDQIFSSRTNAITNSTASVTTSTTKAKPVGAVVGVVVLINNVVFAGVEAVVLVINAAFRASFSSCFCVCSTATKASTTKEMALTSLAIRMSVTQFCF